MVGTVATWPTSDYAAAVDLARGAFDAATRPLGERVGFMDLNRGSDQAINERFAEVARTLRSRHSRPDPGARVPVPAKLPEKVIVESGRPALVVPYVGTYRRRRRPSAVRLAEFARRRAGAVSDALPLLAKDCDALIVEVGAQESSSATNSPTFSSPTWRRTTSRARYQHFVVDEIA